MLWLRQEYPNLFNVNFSDLKKRALEIGIDLDDLVVDEPVRISMAEQSQRFKYLINIEGNMGWADRTRYMLLSESVSILQHTPSHEWFEALLTPEVMENNEENTCCDNLTLSRTQDKTVNFFVVD